MPRLIKPPKGVIKVAKRARDRRYIGGGHVLLCAAVKELLKEPLRFLPFAYVTTENRLGS